MKGLRSTGSEGKIYKSHSAKPQKLRKEWHRHHIGGIIPGLSLQGALLCLLRVSVSSFLQNWAFSQRCSSYLHANPPCSEINARHPTFTPPQPPQSWLLQPTPAKKSATLCSVPSRLDSSVSCRRADETGLSQGSATVAINAIVSNVLPLGVKDWHHSHQIQT